MPEVLTDLRLHYDVVGEGPPVLWHTGGCGDGRMWELAGYVDALPGYRHLLLDHRGRGRSEAPPDLEGHAMSRYVADALATLDDAGAERAVFVGYSLGASIGYAVACAAPDRLTGLVALDGLPDRAPVPDELRAEARQVMLRGTRDVITEIATYEEEPTPDWLLEHLCTTDTLAFAGGFEAEATAPDVWAKAATLPVPTLVLLGVGSEEEWEKQGRELVDRLPDGELVTMDGAHLAAFHRTDLTVPPIRRFLDRVTAGSDRSAPA
jgi:pimeloyl-ACP methyl ester carboxylesterase